MHELPRRFSLVDDHSVVFPRGTRTVLTAAAVDDDGREHRPGVHVVVREVRGRVYRVQTVAGAWLTVPRDQLRPEAKDALLALGARQFDFRRLRQEVVLATVVGSRAWGLADAASDEDIRGCFVLPFADHASIFQAPDEIHDDSAAPEDPQEAFWEVGKLVRQGLRADPNTLETLWSPLVKEQTAIGARLVAEREIFSSMHVMGSFGRYAQSQLQKLEGSQRRRAWLVSLLDEMAAGRVVDEASATRHLQQVSAGKDALHALVRSIFDRGVIASSSFAALQAGVHELGPQGLLPEVVRPKNAYNLVRLLHSCLHWLREGTPLIVVTGPLRDTLLDIKHGRLGLDETLALAHAAAAEVDAAAREPSPLPESPDFARADDLVIEARRQAARVAVAMPVPGRVRLRPSTTTTTLPADVDVPALRRFLDVQAKAMPGPWLFLGLTGAHAYGFPSPDSDLDLKAVHAVSASTLLVSGGKVPPPVEVMVDNWEGREMDLSSHELGQCAELLMKGNGNMLERLLGPWPVVVTPVGEALATWAARNLSQRSVHHYRGFLGAMVREHTVDVRERGGPRAKRLLYMLRAALSGVHLLREGVLVTDVRELAPGWGFGDIVQSLLTFKVQGEYAILPQALVDPFIHDDVPRLFAMLDDAVATSALPEAPPDTAGLDALLVEARLALAG